MSHSEDIYISYYSAILAKVLKLYDDKTFHYLFEVISALSDEKKAYKAKERAFEISKLSLPTLNSKILWLEKLGVEPVEIPEMESLTGSRRKNNPCTAIKENFSEKTNEALLNGSSDIENGNRFDSRYDDFKFIDDIEETKPLLSDDCSNDNEVKMLNSAAKKLSYYDSIKSRDSGRECAIEMREICGDKDGYTINYDTSTKTLYTPTDYRKENCVETKPCSKLDGAESSRISTKAADGVGSSQDESKKKLKKKKKSKTKVDASSESVPEPKIIKETYNSEEFPECSETQPLLEQCSSKEKSVKKTVQGYAGDTKRPEARSSTSTKTEEKNSVREYFTNQKVKEIALLCGDKSVLNKKKAKDSKSNAAKKEKKKLRKQKKADKKNASTNVEINDADEAAPPKPEEVEVKTTCPEPSVNVTDDNSDEFIMQRRKKISHKHSASGRVSPFTKEPTRKRRFSDPSPSTASNEQSYGGQMDASSSQAAKKSWENPDNETVSNEVYDRSNQMQWPTLPSQGDANGSKASDGSTSASYASKLKMNMDSTGCSLASSSEETSSSSSSTNNYQIRTDRSSPLHDPLNALSDISKYIHEAVGFISKSKCFVGKQEANILTCVKDVETLRIVDNVTEAKLSETSDVQFKLEEDVASVPRSRPDTNNAVSIGESALALEVMSTPESSVSKSESKADSHEADSGILDACSLQCEILSKLKNQWGLDFFVSDLSNQASVVDKPEIPLSSAENISELVSFGDGKLPVDTKPSSFQNREATGAERFPLLNICFNIEREDCNSPGDFDVKKAKTILFQEWKKALEKGIHYKDL